MEQLRKNDAAARYELVDGDELLGHVDYVDQGDVIALPHTIVDPEHEGKGYGARLVKFALEDVRAQGKKVDPVCWFVAGYMQRSGRFDDLLQ